MDTYIGIYGLLPCIYLNLVDTLIQSPKAFIWMYIPISSKWEFQLLYIFVELSFARLLNWGTLKIIHWYLTIVLTCISFNESGHAFLSQKTVVRTMRSTLNLVFLLFFGGQMLYNIVLVSATYQYKSATGYPQFF